MNGSDQQMSDSARYDSPVDVSASIKYKTDPGKHIDQIEVFLVSDSDDIAAYIKYEPDSLGLFDEVEILLGGNGTSTFEYDIFAY